jgi:hypothetical protein
VALAAQKGGTAGFMKENEQNESSWKNYRAQNSQLKESEKVRECNQRKGKVMI